MLQKKNKINYNKRWVSFSKKKHESFTRVLPVYQSAASASNTFKKQIFHKSIMQSTNINDSTYIFSSLFINHINKNKKLNIFYDYSMKIKSTKKLTLLDTTYQIQFLNLLNKKLKNYNVVNYDISTSHSTDQSSHNFYNAINQKKKTVTRTSNSIQLLAPQSKINTFLLLNLFLLENYFILSPRTFSNQTTHVLSRVPNYKMNLSSPVSADRYRGNMHKRLSIVNLNRLSDQKASAFLVKLNSFSFIDFLKKNSRLQNIEFLKTKTFLEKTQNINNSINTAYYVKSKIYFIFMKNALKLKYHKQVKEILRQNRLMKKTVKNKKKIKKYAIERTKKITALKPKMKFYKIFLFKIFLNKKFIHRRSKQRQKIQFNLRFSLFRKNHSQKKSLKYKQTRFIKNLLYFSHTKLNNISQVLKKFIELNPNRKYYLAKMTSPKTDAVITNN